ncbi:hypothetical protein EON62_00495, partial [archaeon]
MDAYERLRVCAVYECACPSAVGRGGFFSELRAHLATYVEARSTAAATLRRLRTEGKRIFLATNSHIQYATEMVRFSLGDDWMHCFDIVIYNATKPAFFTTSAAFLEIDRAEYLELHPAPTWSIPLRYRGPDAHPDYMPVFTARGNAAAITHLAERMVPHGKRRRHHHRRASLSRPHSTASSGTACINFHESDSLPHVHIVMGEDEAHGSVSTTPMSDASGASARAAAWQDESSSSSAPGLARSSSCQAAARALAPLASLMGVVLT